MSKSTISNFFEMSAASLPQLGISKSNAALSQTDHKPPTNHETPGKPPKAKV